MRTILYLWLAGSLLFAACNQIQQTGIEEWPVYQGDDGRNQYSSLDQINKENVSKLTLAWLYRTHDADTNNFSQIQCNPIIKNGILYGTSPKLKVFALDAATGSLKWEFDAKKGTPGEEVNLGMNVNRGLALWEEGVEKLILFTMGSWLYCLDANIGMPVHSFGDSGRTSLKQELGERADLLYVASTSPGVVFEDLIIMGTRVSENTDAAPGHIRAFSIRTGKVAWTFHTIPQPGEYGVDTWPENAYKTAGGANSWAGMALDNSRGVVYIPTGSAAFDFYGGNRHGENLFANCILALDARSGERRWHFQTVHHDIWDRDLPAPPNLVTVHINGETRDAVAQITKSGYVFLLDRDTGVPIHPVEEKPFPPSDLEGEAAWPTQPIPVRPAPFARQIFREEDISNISQESYDYVAGILANVISNGQFVPPSREGTIIFPGFDGGAEWGGASVDPATSIMYVNANEMPWILKMVDVKQESARLNEQVLLADIGANIFRVNCAICHGLERQGDPTGTFPNIQKVDERLKREEILNILNTGKGFMPSFKHLKSTSKEAILAFLFEEEKIVDAREYAMESRGQALPFTHTGYNRFLDKEGYPAVKPPWGTLNAIDLNKGELLWQVPLGEFKELTERGMPKTGTENYGGPVATDGDLIFIGATKDEFFRAFDKQTGEELWKYKLPAGGYATPSIYEANGKQYIVIACGGGKMGTKSGDSYVAFTLPDEK
jgi:quinoprotein glucose dehydrogenase